MSRFYGAGVSVEVEVDEQGQPCRIEWEGQEWEIVQIADRWRVDEEWWETRVIRAYFKVSANSAMLLLYRDVEIGKWYIQRLYD